MGTSIHFDKMLPALDTEAHGVAGSLRQLEILIPSGTNRIHLRLGSLNEENGGGGFMVSLDKASVAEFLEGIEDAIARAGTFLK